MGVRRRTTAATLWMLGLIAVTTRAARYQRGAVRNQVSTFKRMKGNMVSAPTASGLVERLVEKGLVSRMDDADDRRVRRLHPTEAGLDVMRDMDSMFGRALGVVLHRLTADDLDLLCRSARAMLAALERAEDQAPA